MTDTAEEIVDKFMRAPHLRLTDTEAETLLATPERSLMMDKLLGVHFFQRNQFARALGHAKTVFEAEHNSENAKNISLIMRKSGQLDEAIEFAREHEELFDPITFNDVLAMVYCQLRDFESAARHGTESLRLKDAAVEPAPEIDPVTQAFDPEKPERNIIAFSLWGKDPRYLSGAQHNAIVARYLYPGWTARFYVDDSVPDGVIKALIAQRAEVLRAPKQWPAGEYGLFWRFLVEDDPNVSIYLIRDADSVMNIKERAAVEDWLASGKAFHVMRDWPAHSELILAGMWGAHRGNLSQMGKRVNDHIRTAKKRLNNRTTDQMFLREKIWPIVRQDVCMHDAWFDLGDPVRYRDEFRLPSNMHIGQNDAVHQARRRK